MPDPARAHASPATTSPPLRGVRAPAAHLFTVDVEEYFQVSAFDRFVSTSEWDGFPSRLAIGVDRILDLLARHSAFGTFFVLGWTARRHPAVVRRIAAAGHEIASHGWTHRKLTTLRPDELRVELRDSKQLLEDMTGMPVVGFRAPSFSLTPATEWAFEALLEEGYVYDSSVFPIRRPGYGFPGAPTVPYRVVRRAGSLLELPLATLDVGPLRLPAAGGAYLRHLPLAMTAAALRAAEHGGTPGMFYMHPWEIDADQPRLRVAPLTRVRHYGGLATMASKVERLLREFSFTSVRRSAHPEISAVMRAAESCDAAVVRGRTS